MKNRQKTLVIIPAYNEEGSVGKVVEEVHTHLPQVELLGVNNWSTDLTSEKLRPAAQWSRIFRLVSRLVEQGSRILNTPLRKVMILRYRSVGDQSFIQTLRRGVRGICVERMQKLDNSGKICYKLFPK